MFCDIKRHEYYTDQTEHHYPDSAIIIPVLMRHSAFGCCVATRHGYPRQREGGGDR